MELTATRSSGTAGLRNYSGKSPIHLTEKI
jgi:hypothetical protein